MNKPIELFTTYEDVLDVLGFEPQIRGGSWRTWEWFVNGEACTLTALRTSPDAPYKYLYYGPEWVFEGLFLETDESLLSRYE